MTAPTQTPLPLPSLKSVEYNPRTVSDWIRDVPEKKPRRQWYPDSVWGGGDEIHPAPLVRSDMSSAAGGGGFVILWGRWNIPAIAVSDVVVLSLSWSQPVPHPSHLEGGIDVVPDKVIWTVNWLPWLNYEHIARTSSTCYLVCTRNDLGQTVSSYGWCNGIPHVVTIFR